MDDFQALFTRSQRILNTLYYATLIWTTTLLFSILFYYYEIFTPSRFWHIVLTTAGYVPLMAAGINISNRNDIIGKRVTRLPIHVILISSSLVSVTLGIGSEFVAKAYDGRKHFAVLHGVLGRRLISYLLMLILVVISILPRGFNTAWKRLIHSLLGLTSFWTGLISLFRMLQVIENVSGSKMLYNFLYWGITYIVFWTSIRVTFNIIRRFICLYNLN